MYNRTAGHPVLALSATSFALPAPPPPMVIDTEALAASSRTIDADASGAEPADGRDRRSSVP